MGSTVVYHYVHPLTHERLASVLPPTHPEMRCLQEGGHVLQTNFGLLGTRLCHVYCALCPIVLMFIPGILAAIFWFPLGIGLCILDRRVKCSRCGLTIDGGLCS